MTVSDADLEELRRNLEEMFEAARAEGLPPSFYLQRYREFVDLVYQLSAGGPPLPDLHKAIQDGSLDPQNVAALLVGVPTADTWDQPPPHLS